MSAILVAGVAWLVYLVLGNTLLPERLRSVAERAGLSLEFDSASTFIPGKLLVRELELSDANAGWSIEAQRVRCEFDLLRLLLGSTRIRALDAEGVVVDIDSTHLGSPEQAALPTGSKAAVQLVHAGWATKQSSAVSATHSIIIEDIRGSGTRLSFGPHTLEGALDYRISEARLGVAGADANLALTLREVELARGGRPSATLQGRIEASVSANPGKPRLWQRMAGSVDLSGTLLSLEPWLGPSPEAVELAQARHRLKFAFQAGRIQSGDFAIDAREATLRHVDGSRTHFSQALELLVRLEPAGQLPIRGKLRADRIALQEPEGSTWAELSDFQLDTRLPDAVGDGPRKGKLRASARKASVSALGASVVGPLAAEATVERISLQEGRVDFGAGTLKTPEARLTAYAAPSADHRIQSRLEIETASLDLSKGLDFRGDLRVQGDDASLLLDLADASETVRWTLSLLEGRSFTLRARLANQGNALTLSQLSLEAAGLSAQGAVSDDKDGTRGAFLVHGPLAIGVSLESGTISTEASVSEQWLEARMQDLSLPR